MNILLDTHIALWALIDDQLLSKEARGLICDERNSLYWSVASMWEIAIKHSIKPDKLPVSGVEFMHYCGQAGYELLIIRDTHIVALESLNPHHNDPFDRLLVAQAQAEGMLLLTHDAGLAPYGQNVRVV
jgi:PIN domain nuclease of toxin-antitoxin system